ncbi:MAG: hypothetical protein Q9192_002768 [Flavoplaca navasiana]
MRFSILCLSLLPLLVQSTNIVLSNDDGWAELNIRVFYDLLTRAGNSVVLSAPAENKSGTGSSDAPAIPLTKPCQFNSCPAGSPATGFNTSNPRLNYVNSFPVTSMRYGIQTLSPKYFGGAPELAVAGFNVGGTFPHPHPPAPFPPNPIGMTTNIPRPKKQTSGSQRSYPAQSAPPPKPQNRAPPPSPSAAPPAPKSLTPRFPSPLTPPPTQLFPSTSRKRSSHLGNRSCLPISG